MMIPPKSTAQRRLEHGIHWTLLSGTALSAVLLVAGLALGLTGHGEPETGPTLRPWRVLEGTQHANPSTILLELGLLTLAATPVLRVIALAIGWTMMGRLRFAFVAVIVLCLFAVSITLGFR
jgi:uncharacterized membrane protein